MKISSRNTHLAVREWAVDRRVFPLGTGLCCCTTRSSFFALWLRGVSVVLITTAIAIPGCASKSLETQTGLASFHGSADDDDLFAAHPSYPFGTLARVTNLENDRKVEVRITDRGPKPHKQAEGRIIDLSWAAARELDFIKEGIVRVRVEVLEWGSDRPR